MRRRAYLTVAAVFVDVAPLARGFEVSGVES